MYQLKFYHEFNSIYSLLSQKLILVKFTLRIYFENNSAFVVGLKTEFVKYFRPHIKTLEDVLPPG